jgi:hypothetical protein
LRNELFWFWVFFSWDWGSNSSFTLVKEVLYLLIHISFYFALAILEMGSQKLFVWVDLKP